MSTTNPSTPKDTRGEDLLRQMSKTKAEWDAEENDDDDDDATDALLSKAIEAALAQGKGWKPGEKEAYMAKYFDDDYIHPLFATTQEELENSGLAEAFTSQMWDEDEDGRAPSVLMEECKVKGNKAFKDGRSNKAKNMQYYRDAINHYYQAVMWADRVKPVETETTPSADHPPPPTATPPTATDDEIPLYTKSQLSAYKSTLLSNAAMSHIQLRNWGHCRTDSTRALTSDPTNLKAWYRLAKSHRMLQNWEEAGDAVDKGLAIDGENKELLELRRQTEGMVVRTRKERQRRERLRTERVARVKEVWRYCKGRGVVLGRVPLVSSVTDDEELDGEDGDREEARWHHHHPHTGCLPKEIEGERRWPSMFLYPSHNQSDFVAHFAEGDMLALQIAEMFPEMESEQETAMPWDYNNEFQCSKLAIYFEVHCTEAENEVVHPEYVEKLKSQGEAMRFYESSRALKGDEGADMANVARCMERKHLHKQRKAWKAKHGSLWAKPNPCPVVRVHPAATLRQVLTDRRMVVPNFIVTFILFPEEHPAHMQFLKEHDCQGIIEPEQQ